MSEGYVISYENGEPQAITHTRCELTSHNTNDVKDRYCGKCHVFIELFMDACHIEDRGTEGRAGGHSFIMELVKRALRWG